MVRCINNKKFRGVFQTKHVPKPVIIHLFGQYDGHTVRGYTLHLNFNTKRDKFECDAPEWVTDQILSSPKQIIAWEHKVGEPNPVSYRYSMTHYKWSYTPSSIVRLTHEFKTKNGDDMAQWIPIV